MESINKLKIRADQRKYEPLAKKVLVAMLEKRLELEEQPLVDDGIFMIHEYFGELGEIEVSVQRMKKHNGINPRFNLKIYSDSVSVDVGGRFAAKAYSMASLEARKEEDSVSDEDVQKLIDAME